ncbi:adenosylcobinamide amidohydrolase [Lysobacter tyrosinilyticus]
MIIKPALASFPDSSPETAIQIHQSGPWLTAHFAAPHRMLSWAIVGGGRHRTRDVAWLQVRDGDLRPPLDAREFLLERLRERGLDDAVGLMTSASVATYTDECVQWGNITARCIATVGMGNALRAGDLPGTAARIGTINMLCALDHPLGEDAHLEALALAAEARALAVREANIPSTRSGEPSSGTGTDCIVVAAPDHAGGARYAGKHTEVGHVLGAAVYAAVSQGLAHWNAAHAKAV